MGWLDLERIVDDDSGGIELGNFFQRSINRRAKSRGVAEPYADLGPLGDANAFEGRIQEKPISRITEPWRPSNNRRMSMAGFDEQGPAMTDYLKHIKSTPADTGNYNPSIWRRMLAGLAGGAAGAQNPLAGIKAAEYVNEMPYRRAVEDYERKGAALESAAKIEETTNRTRQQYQKELLQQDEADKDREVKWYNAQINDRKAQALAERVKLTDQIKLATNEATAQRLRNELAENERKHQEFVDELELKKRDVATREFAAQSGRMTAGAAVSNAATNARRADIYGATSEQNAETNARRADAYTGYMGRLGQPKPPTAAAIGITRRIIEEEIKNEYPDILDAQGAVKRERSAAFEAEIQRRLRSRLGGAVSGAPDDSPYEILSEP